MSFENFPSASTSQQTTPPPRNNSTRNILLGGLLIALLGTWGYIIWDKNQTTEEKQVLTSQIEVADSSQNELKQELNDATMRLDMLKTTNSRADSLLSTKDRDIEDLKSRIQTILKKENASKSELAQAKKMINELNGNIDVYIAEIEKLQGEKIQLTSEKRVVTEERDYVKKEFDSAKTVITQRDDVIDVGSTLHASNFKILGVQEKGSGKEKETTKAKKVDKLRISFDLDENRISPSGSKEIFVCITSPSGAPVSVEALGSGKFVTRDGAEKLFTQRVNVDYKTGEKQTVNVEWKQNSPFEIGDYK
ncbi:MAG: hypothetical protein ABIQ56_00910, partial [Chitinophagaceae bacterium]